jgi:4-aminobutyrate aminotransferase-like enzyme
VLKVPPPTPSPPPPIPPHTAAVLQPDMLLFAKGIASGVPFAGVSARPELYDRMGPGMMVRAVGRSHTGCCWGG